MEFKKEFLSNADLERLGIRSAQTSRNLQWLKADPIPRLKIGKKTLYAVEDVQKYLEDCKVKT